MGESRPVAVLSDIAFEERPGGSERLAALVCEALVRQGKTVEVVAGASTGPAVWQDGATTHRRFPVRTRRHTVQCWDAWKGAARWARNVRCSAVVAFHPSSALGCIEGSGGRAVVAQFFFAPIYREWLHNARGGVHVLPARFLVAWALRRVQARALRASDLVLVLGEYSRGLLSRAYPRVPRVEELTPGVDTRRFSFRKATRTARAHLRLDPTETILLAVRRLVPRTGVLSLVEAFAELNRPGRRLVIVGEGPQGARVRERINKLGLGDCVSLLGHVADEDLAYYYQAADLSVVPSLGLEALGLVMLESMACGTPVATTPVGGAPAIAGKVHPWLVLPGISPLDMAMGLQRVLEECDLKGLRTRSRDLVERRYSLEHLGRRLAAVLEAIP